MQKYSFQMKLGHLLQMQMQTFVYAVKNRFYALPEVKICKESETESPH